MLALAPFILGLAFLLKRPTAEQKPQKRPWEAILAPDPNRQEGNTRTGIEIRNEILGLDKPKPKPQPKKATTAKRPATAQQEPNDSCFLRCSFRGG